MKLLAILMSLLVGVQSIYFVDNANNSTNQSQHSNEIILTKDSKDYILYSNDVSNKDSKDYILYQ